MARTPNPLPRTSSSPGIPDSPPSQMQRPTVLSRSAETNVGSFWDMLAIRVIFAVVCIAAGYHFQPFGLSRLMAASGGLLFAVAVILFEIRLRRSSLRRLIGAATGSILGILGASLISLILMHTTMPESTRSFFSLVIGASKGDMLNLQAFGGVFGTERSNRHSYKLLDTSVIIDGRVADVAD